MPNPPFETKRPYKKEYGHMNITDDIADSYSKESKKRPGGRLNKKDGLSRYGDSHVKDKTS